jgi:2-haloalkanoic acid dehalogenase type II
MAATAREPIMSLADFTTLTFDCYGTLIDWETGIAAALAPLVARAGVSADPDQVLTAFAAAEVAQQAETPAMPYAQVLAAVHARLARGWGVPPDPQADARFGASVPDWPEFPDTPAALAYLKQHFRLVVLSNVDHASFQGSQPRLGVTFDAVHTAQDIGSYKPDPRNFRYLLDRLAEQGTMPAGVLHVAQSLFHDHAPANAAGLRSAWIDRRHDKPGWGATARPPAGVHWTYRFRSLEELAEAHRRGA